jgi:hypothetical protein
LGFFDEAPDDQERGPETLAEPDMTTPVEKTSGTTETAREYLVPRNVDLAELESCAARIGHAVRLVAAMRKSTMETSGVANFQIKDDLPHIPLLHVTQLESIAVSGMSAHGGYCTRSSDDRRWAMLEVEIICEPVLGRTIIRERIRPDLSNAPSPSDDTTKVVASLKRLEALVKTEIVRVRTAISSNANPEKGAELRHERTQDLCNSLAMRIEEEMFTLPDNDYEYSFDSAAPYGEMCATLIVDNDVGDVDRSPLVSKEMRGRITPLFPPQVGLKVRRQEGRTIYEFAKVTTVGKPGESQDAIYELRRHAAAASIDGRIWIGPRKDDDTSGW